MSCVTLSGNLRRVVSIASFLLVKADGRENKAPKVTNVGCCSVFVSRKCLEINWPARSLTRVFHWNTL